MSKDFYTWLTGGDSRQKHLAGQHDQEDHGNRGNEAGVSSSRSRERGDALMERIRGLKGDIYYPGSVNALRMALQRAGGEIDSGMLDDVENWLKGKEAYLASLKKPPKDPKMSKRWGNRA